MSWLRAFLLLACPIVAGAASEPGIPVHYVGGTLRGCPLDSAARLYLPGPEAFLFRCGAGEVAVPYGKITALEYGQEAHRRYGTAASTAALPILWPVSAAVLLKKSHKHIVTIEYDDPSGSGRQAVILRIEKYHIRALLADLEARTGRPVEYQDEAARKSRKP